MTDSDRQLPQEPSVSDLLKRQEPVKPEPQSPGVTRRDAFGAIGKFFAGVLALSLLPRLEAKADTMPGLKPMNQGDPIKIALRPGLEKLSQPLTFHGVPIVEGQNIPSRLWGYSESFSEQFGELTRKVWEAKYDGSPAQ